MFKMLLLQLFPLRFLHAMITHSTRRLRTQKWIFRYMFLFFWMFRSHEIFFVYDESVYWEMFRMNISSNWGKYFHRVVRKYKLIKIARKCPVVSSIVQFRSICINWQVTKHHFSPDWFELKISSAEVCFSSYLAIVTFMGLILDLHSGFSYAFIFL